MVSAAALCLRIYCDERRIGLVSPRRPANRKSDLESSRCEGISQEAPVPTYIVGDIHRSDPAIYQARLPRALATNTPLWWARRRRCRRKIEMSPRVQSRDDTRVPDGHEEERLGLDPAEGSSSAFGLPRWIGIELLCR